MRIITTPRKFTGSFPKPSTPKKSPKPIKKMSEKRKEEIKSGKGQAALFARIWETREHKCSECHTPIHTPEPSNFHHIYPKGKYPELRLVEHNITILCRSCHYHEHFNSKAL